MLTVCHNTIWIVCRNVTAKPSLFRLGYSGNVWLGGTELDGNVWVWSLSGTAIESGLWRPGQPNERSPPRYTYAKRSNVRLYDANDQQMRFMCETSAGFASCWTKSGTAGKEITEGLLTGMAGDHRRAASRFTLKKWVVNVVWDTIRMFYVHTA